MLLDAQADLGMTPEHQLASVSTTPLDGVVDTPPGYAIEDDNTEILEVLLQHGLADKYDMEVLLQLAMKNSSLKCVRVLLESGHVVKRSHDTFLAAHLQGLPYVQSLIEGGYSYSTSFLESHPDILHLYYSKVGTYYNRYLPEPCSKITKLILTEHRGGVLLAEHINTELLLVLLQRMSLRSILRKLDTKTDAENFYTDLKDTIDELLKYNPDMLREVKKYTLGDCFYRAMTNTWNDNYSDWEGVFFVRFVSFLQERGYNISNEKITDALSVTFDKEPLPSDVEKQLVIGKCGILHQAMIQENPCKPFQAWINQLFNLHHIHTTYSYSSICLKHELSMMSHSLQVLYGHGLDIYIPTMTSFDGLACRARLENRPINIQTDLFAQYTFFQAICFRYFHLVQNNISDSIKYIPLMEMLILIAEQLVDFEKEKKYCSAGYDHMLRSMATILALEGRYYTQNKGRIPHKVTLESRPVIIPICRHFLSLLLPHKRAEAAVPILTYYIKEPDISIDSNYKTDIKQLIMTEIQPLLDVQTLTEHCCLYIRKYLFAGNSNNITYCYEGRRFQLGGNVWSQDGGQEPNDRLYLERNGNGILADLESKGLCVYPQSTLLTRLQTLPLPVRLKQRLLGCDNIEQTIEHIRTITV